MKVISTKWVDINEGDEANPNHRSRLVGRDLNLSKQDGLFAGTPPLETLRFVLSKCSSNQGHRDQKQNFLVMTSDVSRAYFYAPATRPI